MTKGSSRNFDMAQAATAAVVRTNLPENFQLKGWASNRFQ
jgi:hypothetical protein